MGNQGSTGRTQGPEGGRSAVPDEPLEAYLREKQRNDHLKNLGLKRHTSLRKSISKKLKRHKTPKPPSSQSTTDHGSMTAASATAEAEAASSIDVKATGSGSKGRGESSTSSKKSHCDVHEDVQPFRRPSYQGGSHPNLSTSNKVVLDPLSMIQIMD